MLSSLSLSGIPAPCCRWRAKACLNSVFKHSAIKENCCSMFTILSAASPWPYLLYEMEVIPPIKLTDGRVVKRTTARRLFIALSSTTILNLSSTLNIRMVKRNDWFRNSRCVIITIWNWAFIESVWIQNSGIIGNYDKSKFSDESPEMIFVAENRLNNDPTERLSDRSYHH